MVRLEQVEGGIGRAARIRELGLILDKTFGIHINKTEFETIPGSLYVIIIFCNIIFLSIKDILLNWL